MRGVVDGQLLRPGAVKHRASAFSVRNPQISVQVSVQVVGGRGRVLCDVILRKRRVVAAGELLT